MNEEKLKELFSDLEAMDAPVTPPSEREWRLFRDALAAEQPRLQIITEDQMKVVILQILSKGRADGGEIVEKLAELKIRLADEGEGVIFALLARMEDEEFLSGQFDAGMVRKTYKVEERGSKLLESMADSVRSLSDRIGMLWAT